MGAVERRGAALALEISGGPWGAPSSREAEILVAEYGSAPLGIVWDEARVQVLERLGAGLPDARRASLVAAARLWRAGDNVGIEVGYLPGMGDRAPSAPDPLRAAAVPVVITGGPDCTLAEVTTARALVAGRPNAKPQAAPNAAPADPRAAST